MFNLTTKCRKSDTAPGALTFTFAAFLILVCADQSFSQNAWIPTGQQVVTPHPVHSVWIPVQPLVPHSSPPFINTLPATNSQLVITQPSINTPPPLNISPPVVNSSPLVWTENGWILLEQRNQNPLPNSHGGVALQEQLPRVVGDQKSAIKTPEQELKEKRLRLELSRRMQLQSEGTSAQILPPTINLEVKDQVDRRELQRIETLRKREEFLKNQRRQNLRVENLDPGKRLDPETRKINKLKQDMRNEIQRERDQRRLEAELVANNLAKKTVEEKRLEQQREQRQRNREEFLKQKERQRRQADSQARQDRERAERQAQDIAEQQRMARQRADQQQAQERANRAAQQQRAQQVQRERDNQRQMAEQQRQRVREERAARRK